MLYVTFLWHMHQPWYLDPQTQRFALPWVRLHGTKDYLDMAELLKEFPAIRCVFNLTPCLGEQIELYGRGIQDEHQVLCAIPAEQLSQTQAEALQEIGFWANRKRMIAPHVRYYELLAKRQRGGRFNSQELRDLQVWSNLCWMDPRWRRSFPQIDALFEKGSHFTEEEKQELLKVQVELLHRILPTYRALADSKQLELTTSPWGHPILPLLFDSEVARQTNAGMPLPSSPWSFPGDVAWHLKESAERFSRWFATQVQGLWPSEGSVSHQILPAVADAGFRWLATDEAILWKSLALPGGGADPDRSDLYRPYQIGAGEKSLALLFRDQVLSDLIGFVYSDWPAEKAAADFLKRLKAIEKEAGGEADPWVLVALDGENAWEHYPDDGEPFLRALYEALSREPWIQCTTVSEHLNSHPPQRTLQLLAAGSWIRGEFSTWIGHEAQNRAWEELSKARRLIGPEACRSVAAAQGSDWFWWLGPEHSSPQTPIFDRLFRSHLKGAYQAAGHLSPAQLDQPLKGAVSQPIVAPADCVTPVVDGEVTHYFEWLRAGEVDLTATPSAMARSRALIPKLWWGFDADHLYLRLDVSRSTLSEGRIKIREKRFELEVRFHQGVVNSIGALPVQLAVGKILELAVPLQAAGLTPGIALELTLSIEEEGGGVVERYPEEGVLVLPQSVSPDPSQWWRA